MSTKVGSAPGVRLNQNDLDTKATLALSMLKQQLAVLLDAAPSIDRPKLARMLRLAAFYAARSGSGDDFLEAL